MSATAIETETLSRRFGPRTAVDGICLRVPERSVFGFLGPNGAGKTTTIRMLLGLLQPTGGRARLCGIDVTRDRLRAAAQVGCLLEAHGFYPNLSGRENLDLTRRLRRFDSSETDRVLDLTDMRHHAQDRVGTYSLGMRQRLGLARAMMGRPPILILDEPTNGLDPDGIAEMRLFLSDLPDRSGATVLVSSHLLGEVEQIATHVGILQAGQLSVQGRLSDLLADQTRAIDLATSDDARARSLALAAGFDLADSADGLRIRLKSRDDIRAEAAALNRALVEAGLDVHRLVPRRPSLEALYRQSATRLSEAA
ncbi:MAG: ABC transporter ATP-binding protein [Caulobacterales bacterium]|nr:ABC transporter ATP-binding protein [Caulobacterales bacterium]